MVSKQQELNPDNYRRICLINLLLSIPLFILFSWPYLYIAEFLAIKDFITYSGSIFFAVPFMITIHHGYATMSLGEMHRHLYYEWLVEHPLTYGLFFHPLMMRTRFRLILLTVSILILIAGSILAL